MTNLVLQLFIKGEGHCQQIFNDKLSLYDRVTYAIKTALS